MTWSLGLSGLLLAAGVTLGACTGPYSTTSNGESSSSGDVCPVGGLGCQCTTGKSCDEGLVCASGTCVKPGGETSTGESTSDTDPTSDSSTTMAGGACDANGVGDADPACPSDQPYCLKGDCFGCSGIECKDISPDQPLCDEATGLCATCVCDDQAPVCNPETHTCSGCTQQSDCPSSACDMWTGACFPKENTLWVDDAGGCDDKGPGDEASPLCTLDVAFERIAVAAKGHHAVRVHPGSYSVQSPLRAPASRVVALVHAKDGAGDVTISAASSSALAVESDGALIVDAVQVPKSSADGLTCTSGKAWLERVTVSEATMHGVVGEQCDLTVRRSVLSANVLSGANVDGGKLTLENSYISENGNPLTGEGGIYLAGGATLEALYSTWVVNRGQAGTPFAVACSDDIGKEKVSVRNSLAINLGSNTLCDGATVEHTGWSTDAAMGTNMAIAYVDLEKYLKEDASLAGVYRVIVGVGLDQLGAWRTGDPTIDFDGDVRPASDNSPDFAGADRAR